MPNTLIKKLKNDFKRYLQQEKEKGLISVPQFSDQSINQKPKVLKTSKESLLENLHQQFANCQNCPLGKTRNKFVFGEGDPRARLMFIGEGPGFDEDQTGRPFIGKAGQLLTRAIEATFGFARTNVYIGNIVKCHPMKDNTNPTMRGNDRAPSWEEIEVCLPIITRQIEIIRPQVICLLGKTAAQTILNSGEGIFQLRSRFNTLKFGGAEIQVMATLHPASCLYDASNKKYIWEDFKKIRDFLKHE